MAARLEKGSRVAVIGGGPAGSLFAYFLLTFARRMDLGLHVDVYEPRDFTKPGPAGCNMCGGIVSESLVQMLAAEGIHLPATVVQRGIDSYVFHSDTNRIRVVTPLKEKRIAAVHRGGGPRDVKERKWGGLDGYLLSLARDLGARVVPASVTDIGWDGGRPVVHSLDSAETYDLLVAATGVKTGSHLVEKLGLPPKRPETAKTYVTELALGEETITRYFGSAMQMFLLDMPRVDCAAIIPKGNFVTVCLLGRGIDNDVVEAFFRSDAVARCFPDGWKPSEGACHCAPKINVREATVPFKDRVVLVGDCGVTRLYKDGIGSAYRTAKAAAKAAVFSGVSSEDFRKHYLPTYREIAADNRFGRLIFTVVHAIKAFAPLLRAVMRMCAAEQARARRRPRMSIVLWDMFTGSRPYREIFWQTFDPRFLGLLLWATVQELTTGGRAEGRRKHMEEGVLGREYADGEVICRQGEEGDRMFMVEAGRAEVVHEEEGLEAVVGELGAGDIFGEMAIFERQPRSATVRAKGPARILTLDKRDFLTRVHEDPSTAYRIVEEMSRRIRKLDSELSRLKGRPRHTRATRPSPREVTRP